MKNSKLITLIKAFSFGLFACLIFITSSNAQAATITWDGSDSVDWATGANWVGDAAPASGDDAVIDGSYTNAPTLDLSGGTTTINSLSVGSTSASVLTFSNGNSSTNKLVVTNDITIGANGTLTHTANSTLETHTMHIEAANINVNSGGLIDVDSKGYTYNNGPGAGNDDVYGTGGGAYGGHGGDYSTSVLGGSAYGSIKTPVNIGSGGGDGAGGHGGGAVKLTISGTLTVAGDITSNGGDATDVDGGGGAGGSILINTGTLSGSGNITANGGNRNGTTFSVGSGSGGRVAVYYTTDSSTVTYNAYAGTTTATHIGGAGTIFTKAAAASNGDLLIKNSDTYYWNDKFVGTTPIDETIAFDAVIIQNYGNLETGSSSNITYSSLDWSTNGYITDNGGTFDVVSGGGSLTIPATARLSGNTARTFTGLSVNGVLTHTDNTTAETYSLNYTINGNVDVASGGSVSATGRGYMYGQGPGAGIDSVTGAGGGAHGGHGGDYSTSVLGGAAYGSIKSPATSGSGGGDGNGGNGGGEMKMTISGTLTVTGDVACNGNDANYGDGGGGAGGSIWITTGTLAGSGNIIANGGSRDGTTYTNGSGSGGRIAVYYTTDSSTVTYNAYAGDTDATHIGGAGTIFTKAAAASNGDLLIKNSDTYYWDDKYVGTTPIDETITFDTLAIQNYGNLETGSSSNITYTTLDWSTKGIITDNGGTFDIVSDGGNLTIPATAMVTGNTARTFTGLTVSGVLTHTANTTAETYSLNYTVNGDLNVASGGSISVKGKGYLINQGPGAGDDEFNTAGGGAHGGDGGDHTTSVLGGDAYGSIKSPANSGSGGGDFHGGNGGGEIKMIVSGSTTVTGDIICDGNDATYYDGGGGAGGSVWINTGTLVGAGNITANGGSRYGTTYVAGSGSGGRIAVYYTTDSSTVTYNAYAGDTDATRIGGAGTIFTKAAAASNGDLLIKNNDTYYWGDRYIGTTPIDETIAFDTLTIQNYGNLETGNSSNITYTTLDWSTKGIITDNGGIFDVVSGGGALTIPATARVLGNTARTFTGLTVNGILTHSVNSSAETNTLNYTVNGDAAVVSGGSINVKGRGYLGGYGPGAGSDQGGYGSGAGYGGTGGATADGGSSGGSSYGSESAPVNIGSGGGDDGGVTGGPAGGGAVKLDVSGALSIIGDITADGDSATNTDGGGASGGSVYLIAGSLSGTATISANGGNPQEANSGGGAGGRIAIYYSSLISAPTATATGAGSTYPGEDGTLYYAYPDYITVTGSTTQVAGASQGITLTVISNQGGTFAQYTGDHSMTFSGANDSPDATTPTCTDKSSVATDIGSAATLTFASGVATSNMVLYKSEAAEIEVTDGTYSSTGDASHDLNVVVSPSSASASDTIIAGSSTAPTAGDSVVFTITAYDQYENQLTSGGDTVALSVAGANTATPSITDNLDGTYSALYTPTTSGSDQTTGTINSSSITKDNDGTSDGTYNITVSAGAASAANAVISGSTATPTAGDTVTFTITAYDAYDNQLASGGDTVVLAVAGSNAETPSITDNLDGTYSALYTPTTSGSDQATGTINASSIDKDDDGTNDGTYSIAISPGSVSAANTIISGSDTSVTAGDSVTFTITAYDAYNNQLTSGGDTVAVTVIGANASTLSVTDNLDGTYSSLYSPANAGSDQVTGTINTSSIDKDDDGTNNGIFNITITAVVIVVEEEEEEEVETSCSDVDLSSSKDGRLSLDICLSPGKIASSEIISSGRDRGTDIRKVFVESKSTRSIDGELKIDVLNKKPWQMWIPKKYKSCIAYKYLKFNPNFSRGLADELKVYFRVSKDWFKDNNIEDIVVVRSNSVIGKADVLKKHSSSANNYIYKETSSELYKWWAIMGCPAESEEVVLDEKEEEENDSEVAVVISSNEPKKDNKKPEKLEEINGPENYIKSFIVRHFDRLNSISTIGVVLSTAPFLMGLSSVADTPVLLKDVFMRLFGVFFSRRKKKRKWGMVYDTKSGRPVPLATVSILNKRGLVKEKKITDKYGSYFFLVPANEYFIRAKKRGYEQLETRLSDSPMDENDINLGKHIEVVGTDVVKENIPFKRMKLNIIDSLINSSLFNKTGTAVFWMGFVSSLAIAITFPDIVNEAVIFVYLVVFAIRSFTTGAVNCGIVSDVTGKSLSFATIKATNQESGEVVSRIVTDEKGKYFMILDQGSYIIEAHDMHGNLSVRKGLKLRKRDALDIPLTLA
ncbi:beta strand repeat-containing protein [Patescibacteria group bacterium]